MRSDPFVSIIIPLFNREGFIVETLKSLSNQTYVNWEAIVVDDGSSDHSFDVAKNYSLQDNRVKVFKREKLPKGAPTCRNVGIENSRGDYIIFLDSDDLLAPYCLEQRVSKFMEHTDKDFLVFPMLVFHSVMNDDNRLVNIPKKENELVRLFGFDYAWLITCPIYKKNVLIELGGFDESLPFWQDVNLHIRLIAKGYKYEYFDNVLPDSYYRISGGESISKNLGGFVEKKEILEKRFHIYIKNVQYVNSGIMKSDKQLQTTTCSALSFFANTYLVKYKDKEMYRLVIRTTAETLPFSPFSKILYLLRANIKLLTTKWRLLKPLELLGKLIDRLLNISEKNLFNSSYMRYKYDFSEKKFLPA